MRHRLHELDSCLTQLEDALERGEARLSRELAGRLSPVVAGLSTGLPITEAQDLVFKEQELCLAARALEASTVRLAASRMAKPIAVPPAEPGRGVMTRLEASRLTQRIKTAGRNLSRLVLRAHEGRAWIALGYDSWEQYARQEFGLSRSRSYELVDQARVIKALSSAAQVPADLRVSPWAIREIKRYVPELLETIRQRASATASRREAVELIGQVVEEKRAALKGRRDQPQAVAPLEMRRPEVEAWKAIQCLATLPPAFIVARAMESERMQYDPLAIERALGWLHDLADRLGCKKPSESEPRPRVRAG